MEVGITRIREDIELPEYKTDGAACFDIAPCENSVIKPGERALLSTGLIINVPEGHALIIAPRSSMAKTGLVMPHSIGIIDSDYCGPEDEMKILVSNPTRDAIKIDKGQRVAQGFVLPISRVIWKEIKREDIKHQTRGGYGSTGK